MSNKIIQFMHPQQQRENAREEAAAWLARIDAGASNEDLERLRLWLEASTLHRDAFFEMAAHWDQVLVLAELAELFPLDRYALKQQPQPQRRGVLALLAGASVAVVAAGVGMLHAWKHETWPFSSVRGPLQYTTEIGEQLTVLLADGSEVILNTNTQVEIYLQQNERSVLLNRGEALFSVAKDPARPFRVYAGLRMVEAVGTAFTVQRTADDLSVMVTEGKVSYRQLSEPVSSVAQPVPTPEPPAPVNALSLAAGEYIEVELAQSTAPQKHQIEAEAIEIKLAWRHGMLLFQGDPLEKVLREVGRYTTIRLEAEEDIRNLAVNGYFRTGDVDGLLVAMQNNFPIAIERISESYIRLSASQ